MTKKKIKRRIYDTDAATLIQTNPGGDELFRSPNGRFFERRSRRNHPYKKKKTARLRRLDREQAINWLESWGTPAQLNAEFPEEPA
ncbi:MAG: hypothetical protein V3W32_04125 [Gemmatimonadota bacterium]